MFGASNDKPSAMETMVAKMLGFTPEQMAETISNFRDTILAVADALKRIEEKQTAILTKLEEQDERRNNGSGRAKRSALPAPGTGGSIDIADRGANGDS